MFCDYSLICSGNGKMIAVITPVDRQITGIDSKETARTLEGGFKFISNFLKATFTKVSF